MKINYKKPYWIKFMWDLSSHHENQYVTEFKKLDNKGIKEFIYNDDYIITCDFKIGSDYKRDEIGAIFGKPGKNLGLTYNNITKVLGFEFWTISNNGDCFNMVIFPENMEKDVNKGVVVSIVKKGDEITLYKNFEKRNSLKFDNVLIEDYRDIGMFLGCSNPGTSVEEHRHHGEVDINKFFILNDVSDIEIAKKIYKTEIYKLIENSYYKNLLCMYDFSLTNNLGIVYDESKNSNFLEKVPKDFVL